MLKNVIYFKKKCFQFALIIPFIMNLNLLGLIDLEESIDSFVLETKRVVLNDYKGAFNPSIIRYQGKLLMSFRIIPNPLMTFNSQLGLTFLDENFEPEGEPQIIDTQDKNTIIPSRAEDGRLLLFQERLFFVYADNKNDYITRGGFRVYVSEIEYDGEGFKIIHTDCLKEFEGASIYLREKNWVPFEYDGQMLLAYSLTPHKIFTYCQGSEKCETHSTSEANIGWEYGELRGGTTALLVGESYLSFFHSSVDMLTAHSNGKKISHYFTGAYTFSSKPPFQIEAISKKPIIGAGFYKGEYYRPYWKSVRCVFPCGFIIEEPYIYLAYGRQDHEMWIAKIDKEGLLNSLIPVEAK